MQAMNHQGRQRSGFQCENIGKAGKDSARQVYRYVRLTYLRKPILNAVDRDVIGIASRCRTFLSYGSRTGDGGGSA